MPSPVTSSLPAHAARPSTSQKGQSTTRMKKSRTLRRRGRARGDMESDDEIERINSTDSDSESDESLSTDSATESEESASEDELPDQQINSHTPNTSHSSAGLVKEGVINEESNATFFSSAGNWSEMVAEENANGAADLPVIEFSDFKADVAPVSRMPAKKTRKVGKKKITTTTSASPSLPTASLSDPTNGNHLETAQVDCQEDDLSSRHPLSHPKRPVGQSARQAYQQKLENDPSFVPKVGGFWGHDDRLMDKDLRSLSGWWRGRWQGRGRGSRGRGPNGIISENGRRGPHADMQSKEENMNLPPIELQWTHDGFEEMKRKEEQRSEVQRQINTSMRGTGRGRGGTPAARGGRGGFSRGGFINAGNRATAAARAGRVWYAMKPELMWTKQSENFLFFESSKHRTSGSTYRIQLPGSRTKVVEPLPSDQRPPANVPSHVTAATASIAGSEIGDRPVVIKLPKREEEGPSTTTELEDVFKVRPYLVSAEPIPLPAPSNTKSPPADKPTHRLSSSATIPDLAAKSQLEQLSLDNSSADPLRLAQTEKAVLRSPVRESPAEDAHKPPDSETAPRRPSLPPIQTVYSPPPAQTSPAYHSSYAYPTLPSGIALNQHGVPYEMATGRPVFIPSSAPPHMYNPRPIMQSQFPQHNLSYISPPHVHLTSAMSPDFSAHQTPSHSHTPSIGVPVGGFIDPATGVPMFSLPRPSRVEIRAPGETANKTLTNGAKPYSVPSPASRGSSHVHVSSNSYSNSPSHPGAEYPYNSYSSSSDVSTLPSYASLPEAGGHLDAGPNTTPQTMVHYPTYQQYYYPDPPYGYSQFMDVSQLGQYEMYPPMEGQGTTYY